MNLYADELVVQRQINFLLPKLWPQTVYRWTPLILSYMESLS